VLGLVLAVINVKQLGIYVGGVAQIVAADVSTVDGWVALVILLIVIQTNLSVRVALGSMVAVPLWVLRFFCPARSV
jgi:hypothetical protein